MTAVVVNPKTGFTIAQGSSNFVNEGVTAATILWGSVSGGPYPNTYAVPQALLTADEASGNINVPLPSVPPGTYYAVCTVTNAAGASADSDEVGWSIVPTVVPAPPVFTVA